VSENLDKIVLALINEVEQLSNDVQTLRGQLGGKNDEIHHLRDRVKALEARINAGAVAIDKPFQDWFNGSPL
jgi:predicted  nucleic acid-binding Zn-ribbon protein